MRFAHSRDGWLSRENVGISVPVPQIPGVGTGTGTQSHGTVGTGTKICGTVPVLKSRGTKNLDISGQESRSVPGRSRCPGIPCDANPVHFRRPGAQFDARDCPAGRESRSIPAFFESRGTGTGKKFRRTVQHDQFSIILYNIYD